MNRSSTTHDVNGERFEVVYADSEGVIEVTVETANEILGRHMCASASEGAKVARGARLALDAVRRAGK